MSDKKLHPVFTYTDVDRVFREEHVEARLSKRLIRNRGVR